MKTSPSHRTSAVSQTPRLSRFIHERHRPHISLSWGLPLMLLALTVSVQAQFNYVTNYGRITITGYTGPGGAVTIPSTINGLPVTSIGDSAFYYRPGLDSVSIPDSVTSIGSWAFADCTALTRISIGGSVKSIGRVAFFFCTSLRTVAIPDSVTFIGDSAFSDCTSLTGVSIGKGVNFIGEEAFIFCPKLTEIEVDPLNIAYSSLEGVLFNKSETTLIQCPGAKAGDYTMPNSVTNIGAEAFYFCTDLTSVMVSSRVINIGYYAFESCRSLSGVYFQGNAPSIAPYAFYKADNATVYYLPGATGWGLTFGGRPTALFHPLVADASGTQPIVISPNGIDAKVVLDGTRSFDPAGELLSYAWYEVGNPSELARDAVSVVVLPVGAHSLLLVANNGILSARNSFTVEVITTAQAVGRLIPQVNSTWPRSRPLVAALSAALASIERDNTMSAINQLLAFQNQVRVQVSPRDAALAETLIQKAQEIIGVLSGNTNAGG